LIVPIYDRTFYDAKQSVIERGRTIQNNERHVLIAGEWSINLLHLTKKNHQQTVDYSLVIE